MFYTVKVLYEEEVIHKNYFESLEDAQTYIKKFLNKVPFACMVESYSFTIDIVNA